MYEEQNEQLSPCCDMSKDEIELSRKAEFERRRWSRPINKELLSIAMERDHLADKILDLEASIKANPESVSEFHKGLWKIQLDAMEGFYNILGELIKDFIDQTKR